LPNHFAPRRIAATWKKLEPILYSPQKKGSLFLSRTFGANPRLLGESVTVRILADDAAPVKSNFLVRNFGFG
jgi:hypothetical protein